MSLLSELMTKPGVIAAGEFSYHGDYYRHEGRLTEEQARWASILARAHNMGVHMQATMLQTVSPVQGFAPLRGWLVRGSGYTVCGMAYVFCFLDNEAGRIDEIMGLLHERLADEPSEMIY